MSLPLLLVGFNLPIYLVFIMYVVLTPLLSYLVIAPAFESRRLPIRFHDQFLTFVVGDIALAWLATWMTASNRQSEYQFIPMGWPLLVAIVTVAIAIVMTRGELQDTSRFAYKRRSVLSPTKLYHNFVLYAGYVWLLVMLLTQVIMQGPDWSSLWMAIPLLIWVATMYIDNAWSSDDVKLSRAMRAHVDNWEPCWSVIRRHGFTGYWQRLRAPIL